MDFPVYTMDEVSNHCEMSSCWIVIENRVYDVTTFIDEHPAGIDVILENAGRDATVPFQETGHSRHAATLLEKYCIGMLVERERIHTNLTSHCLSPTLVKT